MSEDSFWMTEKDVADRLGLTLRTLRELRQQHLGPAHFTKKGAAIWYSSEGLDALGLALGVQLAGPELELPEPAKEEHAEVLRLCRNPHIILILVDGRLARLKVKHGAKFVAGMAVPVRKIDGDLYELTVREPRWRGKF